MRRTRRTFLRQSAGALGLSALYPLMPPAWGVDAREITVAVQLGALRRELDSDIPAVLDTLHDWGVAAVEFAGFHGKDAATWRRYLDAYRIAPCGNHVTLSALEGRTLRRTLGFHRAIGNTYLIIGALPSGAFESKRTLLRTAARLNAISRSLEPESMLLGLHSQVESFQLLGGEYAWDILAGQISGNVALQFDTGQAARLGVGVPDLLKRHAWRTIAVHAKPYSATELNAVVGQDDLDWRRLIRIGRLIGTRYFVVDVDRADGSDTDDLFANLVSMRLLMKEAGLTVG